MLFDKVEYGVTIHTENPDICICTILPEDKPDIPPVGFHVAFVIIYFWTGHPNINRGCNSCHNHMIVLITLLVSPTR